MSNLKVDIITNSGFLNLDREFEILFKKSNLISIATAFINKGTIELIEDYLWDCSATNKKMRLIVGLYGGFNLKRDLEELLKLAKKYPDNFACRISQEPGFHWKYYSFKKNSAVTNFVGSANFTTNGLCNPGELTLKLTGKENTREIRILKAEFEKIWEKDTIDIITFPLNKYHSKSIKIPDSAGFKIDISIKKLLNKSQPRRRRKLNIDNNKCLVDIVDSYTSKGTSDIVYGKRSNWEKNNYDVTCLVLKSDYLKWEKAKYILQYTIVKQVNVFALYEVMDSCEIRTDDGKYFVALRRVKGTRSKQLKSDHTKQFLRHIGLRNNKNQRAMFLNWGQTKNVFDFFGVK